YICPERPASRRSSSTTRREKRMYAPSSSARSIPRMMTGARPRIRLCEVVAAEVRAERGRNRDGAIRALVVLQDGDDGTRKGERRSVESVNEARLLAGRRTVANVRASRLKIREQAARRHLEPLAHPRRPELEVVRLGRREARVSRREQHHPVRQLAQLQHALCVRRDRLELLLRRFRRREANQLHL